MKIFSKLIVLCVILFLNVKIYAQLDKHISTMTSNTTFQDISTPEQTYLANLEQSLDSATFYSGGGEYKTFKRFQYFWESRLYPNEKFETYSLAQQAFYSTTYQNYINASTEIWKELGPTNSSYGIGPAEFITIFDNGTAASTQYMLTGAIQSGLFYSKDFGETWSPAGTDKWTSSGCSWAVYHPTNYQSWCASSSGNSWSGKSSYMGRTGGVYLTTDEGQTWVKKADYLDFNEWAIIRKLIWDPSNTNRLYVATSKGLYKTNDLNNSNPSWIKILDHDINDIEMKPNNNNTIYAACSETQSSGTEEWTIRKSINNGTSWSQLYLSNNTPISIEVSKAKPDYLYQCKLTGNTATLSYYNNSWTSIANSSSMNFGHGHTFGIEQVQDGESLIISYGTSLKKLSINGTVLPTSYPNHSDVEDVVYHPYNNNEVWICTHGGPEKSTDGGNTWIAKYNGVGTAMTEKMATSYTNPEYVMLGLYHDGTQITRSPYTDNWKPSWQHITGGDGQQPLIDNKDPKHMWSSLQKSYGIYYSNNYFLSGIQGISSSTYFYAQAVLNKENSNYLYVNRISGGKENVNRFSTRGATSGNIISDFGNMLDPSIAEILTIGMVTPYYSNDELIVWVVARGGTTGNGFHVFRTRNATSSNPTWIELSIPRSDWINDIEFDPDNTDIVYLSYSNSSDKTLWPLAKNFIYKVDYTNTTNPVFTSITKNLPYSHTASYCLEYERGSDGVLYLATDFGVFTTNNQLLTTNDAWQLLGTGLPNISSNGIEINYPMNLLRVGTGGRGAWEIPLPCSHETANIEIDQNTTWNTIKRINRDVIVKDGYKLTISNTKIAFTSASKIIVEPGGELILDGCTLTSACNTYWQGIEVWGDKTLRQLDANQGKLQVINGGTIMNAINAIAAVKYNPDGTKDWSKTGGIIKLNDANMINNNFDIWIGGYHNFVMVGTHKRELGNSSSIINSHFENNDNMLSGYEGYAFIGLWDVGRVSINGNTFKNLKTGQTTQQKGRGIVAISSTISLGDYCPSGSSNTLSQMQALNNTPCTGAVRNYFEGLYYGIEANSVTGFNNSIIYVDRAEFNDVYHGVHILNTKYAGITRCDFDIANTDPGASSNNTLTDAYGIYLDGSDAYRIEENNFTKKASQQSIRGILVNESGSTDNELYKNNLTNLGYAIQAQGNNRGTGTGLGIYCNEMSGDNMDIVVLDDGIAESQKITVLDANNIPIYFAAGDVFTSCNSNNYQNYYNSSTGNIIYYADVNNVPQCTYGVTVDQSVTPLLRSCPTKLGGTLAVALSSKSSAKLAWNSAKTIYTIWKDGGNANLDEEVETTQPWDVYVQFNSLLAESPYLSDDVLMATIENPAFTSLMIKLLMVANTHASHNEEIMQAIYDRIPAMPEAYIIEIEAGESNVSQLEVLEANVAACKHAYTIYTNDAKRIYQMDYEEGDDVSTYISFLASLNTLESEYELATLYLENDDYDNMTSTLNAISNDYTLDAQQTTDLSNWQTYFNTAKTVKQADITMGMLTESQKTQLEAISVLENSPTAHSALALLIFDNPEYAYYEVVKPVTINNARMAKPISNTEQPAENEVLKVYPNPSHDYITLEYRTDDKYSNLNIAIKDATGKTVLTKQLKGGNSDEMINLSELKSGVYSLILYGDATLIEVEKITVLK